MPFERTSVVFKSLRVDPLDPPDPVQSFIALDVAGAECQSRKLLSLLTRLRESRASEAPGRRSDPGFWKMILFARRGGTGRIEDRAKRTCVDRSIRSTFEGSSGSCPGGDENKKRALPSARNPLRARTAQKSF